MKTERDLLMETMEKAKIFKQIKKEYLKDKIIGYYYFQSFLGFSLPKYQIDFILNSKDAYSILKVIKNSNGKYTFDAKKFKSKINKLKKEKRKRKKEKEKDYETYDIII